MDATLFRRPSAIVSIIIAAALVLAGTCAVAAPQADAAAKKPARAKIASVKSAQPGQLTVTVKKAKRAKGYQFKVGTDAKLAKDKKAIASKKRTATFTGLKQGKRYYVKVRAFSKKGKKKLWGKWSKAKSAAVKAAPAPDPGPAVSATGVSGSCTWTLYEDGSLVVAPTAGASGTLGTWTYQSGAPWSQHASEIKTVAFRGEVVAATCRDMFKGCSNLASINLSGLDTSGVEDMVGMFSGCSSLEALGLSRFDTSSATNMAEMFYNCYALTTLDLTGLKTSGVRNMESMFEGCSSLETLGLTGLDTSGVGNMISMFRDCSKLETLDLSRLDTSGVAVMSSMFRDCSSLVSLDLNGFDTSQVIIMESMFSGCTSLGWLKTGTGWSYSKVDNSSSKPRFPRSMRDVESGEDFTLAHYIPEGAHAYRAT